jgi:hypothetical protein
VHHNHKPVFPVAMEFIQKQDGASKNDCELNAAKRIIAKLKTAHPHLKMRMLCDALARLKIKVQHLSTGINLH